MDATKNISNEIVTKTKERNQLTLLSIIRNEYFLYAVSLCLFFGSWHWVAVTGILGHSSALASPLDVLACMHNLFTDSLAGQSLLGHIWASSRRVFIGFFIAIILGIPLGLTMGLNPYINAFVKPVFDCIKPMPPLAWISLAILWLGIQEAPKIFIITIGSFVPCVLNAYNGIRLIEPELYDVVRIQGGTRWDEIKRVAIPASLPAIMAGLQLSLSLAWGCVVAAELVSSRSGVGYLIMQGMKMSDPALVIAGMLIIAGIAWVTAQFMDWLDKRFCPWRRTIQGL